MSNSQKIATEIIESFMKEPVSQHEGPFVLNVFELHQIVRMAYVRGQADATADAAKKIVGCLEKERGINEDQCDSDSGVDCAFGPIGYFPPPGTVDSDGGK